ncbi:SCO family protein [Cognatiluteimonas profundi]|uniref:SCO family protein n=1 Tax=Cognatiluteimonas profundi TaxID=2594501 RepID=UPI00131E8A8C|nr:SCO family protein [Lysobacter profundi]
MKIASLAFSCLLLLASGVNAAPAARPLPSDSVYQLPLVLTDQGANRWDWRSKRGKPQVVAMFYTSCQFTCPLIVDSGKAIEHALGPASRGQVGLLLISLDPRRDTPAALRRVVKERELDLARWSLASPRPQDVRDVAGVLGVRYRQLANGDFNHTSGLLLLDREGRIVARTDKVGTVPDPEFVKAVRRSLAP